MSLDTALFLVNRGGTKYHVAGADINSKVVDGDQFLVQRNGQRYRYSYNSNWDTDIEDTDLLLVWESNQSKSVTGAQFKTLFTTTNTIEDAQECHRQAYSDYQYCKLLCETAYCANICDTQYEEEVKECYESRGFDVPIRITPPPRV